MDMQLSMRKRRTERRDKKGVSQSVKEEKDKRASGRLGGV